MIFTSFLWFTSWIPIYEIHCPIHAIVQTWIQVVLQISPSKEVFSNCYLHRWRCLKASSHPLSPAVLLWINPNLEIDSTKSSMICLLIAKTTKEDVWCHAGFLCYFFHHCVHRKGRRRGIGLVTCKFVVLISWRFLRIL